MTSAELITELQATRPAADGALRDRVRAIAAAEPARRSSPFARLPRYSPRRFALVALPATAVVLLAVAGVAGLLDSGSRPGGRGDPRRPLLPERDGPRHHYDADERARTAAQGRRNRHRCSNSRADDRSGPALLGSAHPVGEEHRRSLRRHTAGAADHARPGRLPGHGVVCDDRLRHIVPDAEGADRERAAGDRAALGPRQDRRPADPDRRPPGPGGRADEARERIAPADRAALGPARSDRPQRRDAGNVRGPPRRCPQ